MINPSSWRRRRATLLARRLGFFGSFCGFCVLFLLCHETRCLGASVRPRAAPSCRRESPCGAMHAEAQALRFLPRERRRLAAPPAASAAVLPWRPRQHLVSEEGLCAVRSVKAAAAVHPQLSTQIQRLESPRSSRGLFQCGGVVCKRVATGLAVGAVVGASTLALPFEAFAFAVWLQALQSLREVLCMCARKRLFSGSFPTQAAASALVVAGAASADAVPSAHATVRISLSLFLSAQRKAKELRLGGRARRLRQVGEDADACVRCRAKDWLSRCSSARRC